MTTTVKVSAHCADNKEVEVLVSGVVSNVLQNGQEIEVYAYDDREILVREVVKVEPAQEVELTEAASDVPVDDSEAEDEEVAGAIESSLGGIESSVG